MNMKELDQFLPVWLRSDRTAAAIESRPVDAGPEWPEGAVERVTFTAESSPGFPRPRELPGHVFLGSDGWPLGAPADLKPQLIPELKEVFRRSPLALSVQDSRASWTILTTCKNYESWVWLEKGHADDDWILAVSGPQYPLESDPLGRHRALT